MPIRASLPETSTPLIRAASGFCAPDEAKQWGQNLTSSAFNQIAGYDDPGHWSNWIYERLGGQGLLSWYAEQQAIAISMIPGNLEHNDGTGRVRKVTTDTVETADDIWMLAAYQLQAQHQLEAVIEKLAFVNETIGKALGFEYFDDQRGITIAKVAPYQSADFDKNAGTWSVSLKARKPSPDQPSTDVVHGIRPESTFEVVNGERLNEREPTSPMRALVETMRTLEDAQIALGGQVASYMLGSVLLWAPISEAEAREAAETRGAPKFIRDFKQQTQRTFSKRDRYMGAGPGLITSDNELKKIDTGAGEAIQRLIEIEEHLVKQAARVMPVPTKWLTEGPGSANEWGEHFISRHNVQFNLSPRRAAVDRQMDEWRLYPTARRLEEQGRYKFEGPIEAYSNGHDISPLVNRVDDIGMIFEAVKFGVLKREVFAERASLDVDDLLELPEGVSWAEFITKKNESPTASPSSVFGPSEASEPDESGAVRASSVADMSFLRSIAR